MPATSDKLSGCLLTISTARCIDALAPVSKETRMSDLAICAIVPASLHLEFTETLGVSNQPTVAGA